jgi:carboxymethylenebutenolidase
MSGEKIQLRTTKGSASGYLAKPEAGGNGRGVIVLQEWWGLVPHIQSVADRFAKAGYVALAPDLWDGKQTTRPDEAGRLFMALDIADAASKLQAAGTALREQGGARGGLGVVGFCMGGQLALYAATVMPEIGACVDFYGRHAKVHPDYTKLRAPVLGIFGENDKSIGPEVVAALGQAVRAAGGSIELHSYPAGHAFFNDTRPEVFDAACAADAWRRTIDFLGKNLH